MILDLNIFRAVTFKLNLKTFITLKSQKYGELNSVTCVSPKVS